MFCTIEVQWQTLGTGALPVFLPSTRVCLWSGIWPGVALDVESSCGQCSSRHQGGRLLGRPLGVVPPVGMALVPSSNELSPTKTSQCTWQELSP